MYIGVLLTLEIAVRHINENNVRYKLTLTLFNISYNNNNNNKNNNKNNNYYYYFISLVFLGIVIEKYKYIIE